MSFVQGRAENVLTVQVDEIEDLSIRIVKSHGLKYIAALLTAGIQFAENVTRKYTRPSRKSNFHRSVRAVCFLNSAKAVKNRIIPSKPIADEPFSHMQVGEETDGLRKNVALRAEGLA